MVQGVSQSEIPVLSSRERVTHHCSSEQPVAQLLKQLRQVARCHLCPGFGERFPGQNGRVAEWYTQQLSRDSDT